MTFKEWLIENKPDADVEDYIQWECPPSNLGHIEPNYCIGQNPIRCKICWDREIPKDESIDDAEAPWLEKHLHIPEESSIKDSGDRTEFATGAVRDMREGKGRCDLMPLEVVAEYLVLAYPYSKPVMEEVANFKKTNCTMHLYFALGKFAKLAYDEKDATMLLEVAKHFEEGAKKYGENNWQKGIPVKCYIDSAIRHYLKWLRGDKDEPHDRAFVWNLMCCIWEVDYREKEEEKENA
jgi:hypothetical protein